MTITKRNEGNKLTIELEGRLDTTTAPELEAVLKESLNGVSDLTLDMEQLCISLPRACGWCSPPRSR